METFPQQLGPRYVLHAVLGQGGMGRVYRALDRLTGQTVALKRVLAAVPEAAAERAQDLAVGAGAAGRPADATITVRWSDVPTRTALGPGSGEGASGVAPADRTLMLLTLAQEFNILAGLRHPHIISVRDYGFDAERRPFFTMDYLEGGRDVVEEGVRLAVAGRVGLLVQVLSALAYLHRQDVLHRDLKPSNILVEGGRVKLVDFGLSLGRRQGAEGQGLFGTVAYMAPELFDGAPATEASDLYAFGLVAYELLIGNYPYRAASAESLIQTIRREPVSVDAASLSPGLAAVLNRLLAPDPAARYPHARDVLVDLCRAAGLSEPAETLEIRDSFLQAAHFVGRERDLGVLLAALDDAIAGRGGTCLVGGESGVGKSRLVHELRTQATVRGAHVLRGRCVEQGGGPFTPWRDVLLALALHAEPDDEEAAVLKGVAPEIEALLQRPVRDAPPLDPLAAERRRSEVVGQLLQRVRDPVVLLFEDLHWAGSETMALLGRVHRAVDGLPVLLVGTFRDDERPDLPKDLPGARLLRLGRLDRDQVVSLSESILGPAGRSPALSEFLLRETEGNVLFLVEVMRNLADEAGTLDGVATMALPAGVSSGNLQALLRRRLARVPASGRALLELAAVAGRRVDAALLRHLAPDADLEPWLLACAGAAVLSIEDEQWQFAHDKLREAVLVDLAPDAAGALHRRVAEAIEAVHPASPAHASALAYHWGRAGDADRELRYTDAAGQHAVASNAHVEAARFFQRALELLDRTPPSAERFGTELRLQLQLGGVLMTTRGFAAPEVERAFGRAYEIARGAGGSPLIVPVLWGLYAFYSVRADVDTAEAISRQLREAAEGAGTAQLLAQAAQMEGAVLVWRGRVRDAIPKFEQYLAAADRKDPQFSTGAGEDPEVRALSYLAVASLLAGRLDEGLAAIRRAVDLGERLSPQDHMFALGFSLWLVHAGFVDLGRESAARCVTVATKHEFAFWLITTLMVQGIIRAADGELGAGVAQFRQYLATYEGSGARLAIPTQLCGLAGACLRGGVDDEAQRAIDEAAARTRATGDRILEAEALRLGAVLAERRGDDARAEAELRRALDVAAELGTHLLGLRAATDLARIYARTGRRGEGAARLAAALAEITGGDASPDVARARAVLAEIHPSNL